MDSYKNKVLELLILLLKILRERYLRSCSIDNLFVFVSQFIYMYSFIVVYHLSKIKARDKSQIRNTKNEKQLKEYK